MYNDHRYLAKPDSKEMQPLYSADVSYNFISQPQRSSCCRSLGRQRLPSPDVMKRRGYIQPAVFTKGKAKSKACFGEAQG